MTAGDSNVISRPGLSRLAQEILPCLYKHRLMSVRQLQQLLQPHTTHPVYLRRQLRHLHEQELARTTVRRTRGAGELLWYLTPAGAEAVERSGEVRARSHRMSAQAAAGQLQEHTLAVNDVGVAMVAHAQQLGDECGPLYWDHEVAHRVREGENRAGDRAFLVPDAVLSYTHAPPPQPGKAGRPPRTLLTWFIEVDRCTEPVTELASKIALYARYRHYVSAAGRPGGKGTPRQTAGMREAWRERYLAFPRLLIVLAGAEERRLRRRMEDLRGLAATHSAIARNAASIETGMTTLPLLQQHGPMAPIVATLTGPDTPVDALLRDSQDPVSAAAA